MKPIQDIRSLRTGSVLYHSAFGFSVVESIEPASIVLRWEQPADHLPGRVAGDVVTRVYALCDEQGFFAASVHDRDALVEKIAGSPLEALTAMMADLDGPQRREDLLEWMTGRRLMSLEAFGHWWSMLAGQLEADDRFEFDGIHLRKVDANGTSSTLWRLDDESLSAKERMELLLTHRADIDNATFLHHATLAWRTGSTNVRDLALKATSVFTPNEQLRALLAPGPDALEAILHGLRRAGWDGDTLAEDVKTALLDRVVTGCDDGGPLDHEGRLTAILIRWKVQGLTEVLTDLAASPNGKRLIRSTLNSLPTETAEHLAITLLQTALDDEALDTATWLAGEALSVALVEPYVLANRVEPEHPRLAAWFRQHFASLDQPPILGDLDETTAHTAEVDFTGTTSGPVPLRNLPPRSGASLLGLGLSLARALAAQHRDGTLCNPNPDRIFLLPSEAMEITPGSADDAPIPNEVASPARDVYAAAVVLLGCLLGRPWPGHIAPQRAIPYLRFVIPLLPPSAMAPLDAALHPDPSRRPADGLAWQALWQLAAVAEENRGYAERDTTRRLQLGYDSHIGRMKVLLTQTNQDALFVSNKGPLSFLVVCDGISTANAGSGDVASSIASHVMATLWEQALPRLVQAGPSEVREFLDRALRLANQAVCEAALRYAGGNLEGRIPMGTTAVVALVYGNRVWLSWLGDSRAYLVGTYGASLLTFDENQASERLRAWHLRYLEHWDPAGFALIGYLGHFDEMWRPEALPAHHTSFTLVPGERLVLCSDGVTDYLGDTHPEASFFVADSVHGESPYEAAHNLIAQANRGGGGDNITSVVAMLDRS